MVGVAQLPGRARARVRLEDVQIEVVHHTVEVEVAGICGHHRHLARPIVKTPQRQSGSRGGRIPELANVPAPTIATVGQQLLDRRHRAGSAIVVEDQRSALDVGAAEVEHRVLRRRSQLERPGRERGRAGVRVAPLRLTWFVPSFVSPALPLTLPEIVSGETPPTAAFETRLTGPANVTFVPASTACKAPLPSPVPARSIGSLIVPVSPPPALRTAPLATTVFAAVVPKALTLRI